MQIEIDDEFTDKIKEIEELLRNLWGAKFGFWINGEITLTVKANEEVKKIAESQGITTCDEGIIFIIQSNSGLLEIPESINALNQKLIESKSS